MGIKEFSEFLAQRHKQQPPITEDEFLMILLDHFPREEIPGLVLLSAFLFPDKANFLEIITQKLVEREARLTSLFGEIGDLNGSSDDEMPELKLTSGRNYQKEEEIDPPRLTPFDIETTQSGTGKALIAMRLGLLADRPISTPTGLHNPPLIRNLTNFDGGAMLQPCRLLTPLPSVKPVVYQVPELKLLVLTFIATTKPHSLQKLPEDIQDLTQKIFRCYFCQELRTAGQFCSKPCCQRSLLCMLVNFNQNRLYQKDIDLVKSQTTGVCIHRIIETLIEKEGDIVDTIIELSSY